MTPKTPEFTVARDEIWIRRSLLSIAFLAVAGGGLFLPEFMRWLEFEDEAAEAKTNLSGLFTAQKAFFGEYMTYGTDLVSVNWLPDGKPQFVYGFCNEFPTGGLPGISGYRPDRKHTNHPDVVGTPPAYSTKHTAGIGDPCVALGSYGLASKFKVDGQSFLAFAVGNLDSDADLEIWSINHTKQLSLLAKD